MPSIVDRVGDLGEYLREQREGARLSVRQLAALAGVSNPYLSQVERGLRHPSAEVLQQIAKGLRISAEALYIRAGILDPSDRPDVESAIAADPHLADRQRRVLLDIYASFRSENARAEELLTEAAAAAEAVSQSAPRPAKKTVARKAAANKAGTTAKKAGTTAKKVGTTAKKAGTTAKKAVSRSAPNPTATSSTDS
jgi:transcriptional regulator with XRE-family HTH domain